MSIYKATGLILDDEISIDIYNATDVHITSEGMLVINDLIMIDSGYINWIDVDII